MTHGILVVRVFGQKAYSDWSQPIAKVSQALKETGFDPLSSPAACTMRRSRKCLGQAWASPTPPISISHVLCHTGINGGEAVVGRASSTVIATAKDAKRAWAQKEIAKVPFEYWWIDPLNPKVTAVGTAIPERRF